MSSCPTVMRDRPASTCARRRVSHPSITASSPTDFLAAVAQPLISWRCRSRASASSSNRRSCRLSQRRSGTPRRSPGVRSRGLAEPLVVLSPMLVQQILHHVVFRLGRQRDSRLGQRKEHGCAGIATPGCQRLHPGLGHQVQQRRRRDEMLPRKHSCVIERSEIGHARLDGRRGCRSGRLREQRRVLINKQPILRVRRRGAR